VQYRRYSMTGVVPRIEAAALAERLASQENKDIIVADVRSHGYYDAGAARIAGSIRLEPNRLEEELKTLPKDKDIYLYCT
jgi:rhodanese-related sulfurtransferase